jgi:hypothetical protein
LSDATALQNYVINTNIPFWNITTGNTQNTRLHIKMFFFYVGECYLDIQAYRYLSSNYLRCQGFGQVLPQSVQVGYNASGFLQIKLDFAHLNTVYSDCKIDVSAILGANKIYQNGWSYTRNGVLGTFLSNVTINSIPKTTSNFTGLGTQASPLDLANTGIAAGTYNTITLDTKGRATSATNTPYLPLTSTTNQTLNYGSNVLNINGQINLVNATTRLIAQDGEGEHGYDDGAGVRNGLVFSDGQVHIRSTNGSNSSGIGVLTNGLPNVYYPGSTTANEGDALVLTNPASGEIKFGKTKKKIAYPPITSTITLTDEDVVLFHGANGNFNFGSTIYNLPNTPNFCGRTVSFINDWGYNNSSSYMKANSTLSNIENVAGGGFTNSLSINFKAKLVCTCASGGVYWMQE